METIQEFAQRLNGREYKQEMTEAEAQKAKALGYVVVYGYSDEKTIFHGAIEAMCDTRDGGALYITKEGLYEPCPCQCIHSQRAKAQAKVLTVDWCKGPYVWSYKIDMPCASFEIIDNQPAENLKFCQGLVFDLKAIQ